jgi:hypothetical protein
MNKMERRDTFLNPKFWTESNYLYQEFFAAFSLAIPGEILYTEESEI